MTALKSLVSFMIMNLESVVIIVISPLVSNKKEAE